MSGTVTGLDLTRLEALAEKATPGEWWASEAIGDDEDAVLVGVTRDDAPDGYAVIVATPGDASFAIEPTNRDEDAEFIAAMRNAVPALLAAARERDALRVEVARVRASVGAEIESWQHHVSEDCWYTCPAATEGREGASCCNDAMEATGCDCGLDFRRSRLRAALGTEQEGQQ